MLTGKTVVLGVTGSIAAYKIANLASALVKLHADVHVIMTRNATNFINPITFETLTGNKCYTDTFDRDFSWDVKHISLAKKADVIGFDLNKQKIGLYKSGVDPTCEVGDDAIKNTSVIFTAIWYSKSACMSISLFIAQCNYRKLQSLMENVASPKRRKLQRVF